MNDLPIKPMDALGGAGKLLGLLFSLKASEETAAYREEVLDKLNKIDEGLEQVSTQIKALKGEIAMSEIYSKSQQAEAMINTWFHHQVSDWLLGKTPPAGLTPKLLLKTDKGLPEHFIFKDCAQYLDNIDEAIMRKGVRADTDEPTWFEVALNQVLLLDHASLKVSLCEKAYLYSRYLLALQIRGWICLHAVGSPALQLELTADKLRQRLVAQAKVFQEVVNKASKQDPDKFVWYGGTSGYDAIVDPADFASDEFHVTTGDDVLASAQFARGPENACHNQWGLNIAVRQMEDDGSLSGTWTSHACGCGANPVQPRLFLQGWQWNMAPIELPKWSVMTGIGFAPRGFQVPVAGDTTHPITVVVDLRVEYVALKEDGEFGERKEMTNYKADADFDGKTMQVSGCEFKYGISTDWRGDGPFTGVRFIDKDGKIALAFKNDLMLDRFAITELPAGKSKDPGK